MIKLRSRVFIFIISLQMVPSSLVLAHPFAVHNLASYQSEANYLIIARDIAVKTAENDSAGNIVNEKVAAFLTYVEASSESLPHLASLVQRLKDLITAIPGQKVSGLNFEQIARETLSYSSDFKASRAQDTAISFMARMSAFNPESLENVEMEQRTLRLVDQYFLMGLLLLLPDLTNQKDRVIISQGNALERLGELARRAKNDRLSKQNGISSHEDTLVVLMLAANPEKNGRNEHVLITAIKGLWGKNEKERNGYSPESLWRIRQQLGQILEEENEIPATQRQAHVLNKREADWVRKTLERLNVASYRDAARDHSQRVMATSA